ncbi:MAG TPA: cytochrome o ubiquinol oxidase subunit IV [Bordetella sp.]
MSHSHAVDHDHAADSAGHGSLKSYIVGFALSIILTLISFWLVMSGSLTHDTAMTWVVVFAIAQLLVQLIFFLHLGTAKSQQQNTAIFLFTVLILAIAVGGSLWVMHNANVNMMPAMGKM